MSTKNRRISYLIIILFAGLTLLSSCTSLHNRRSENYDQIKTQINKGEYEEVISLFDREILKLSSDKTSEAIKLKLSLLYLEGRIYEKEKDYKKAFFLFKKGLEVFGQTEGISTMLGSKDYMSFEAAYLYELCYCAIQLGGEDYQGVINDLTQLVLSKDNRNSRYDSLDKHGISLPQSLVGTVVDDDERYYLLKHCFSLIHALHTGNTVLLKKSMEECLSIAEKEKGTLVDIINPFSYFDKMADETFMKMLIAYSQMSSDGLKSIYEFQTKIEKLYDSPIIKTLLWGGQALNLYKNERAIIFGFGAYGYSLLGKYDKSKEMYLKAIDSLSRSRLNSIETIIFGNLHIAYADGYLIPTEDSEGAKKYIDEGNRILNELFNSNNKFDQLINDNMLVRTLESYRFIVTAKLNYIDRHYEEAFLNVKEAFTHLHRASPKQFVLDAIYYAALAVKGNKNSDFSDFKKLLKEADYILSGYEGYDKWKLYYAQSLMYEKDGDLDKALEAARESVDIVEKLWNNRCPDLIQQVTFMEDKGLPYHRTIDLILRSNAQNTNSLLFDYIERLKTHLLKEGRSNISSVQSNKISGDLLSNVQKNLSKQEAVIQLYYHDNYFLSFFITNSDAAYSIINDDDKNISNLIVKFGENIKCYKASLSDSSDLKSWGYDLYSNFVNQKGKITLDGIEKIYIIPFGKLNLIPWNALSVKEENIGNDYLIDHLNVTVLPNTMSLQASMNDNEGQKHKNDCGSFFIGSDNNGNQLLEEEKISDFKCYRLYVGDNSNVENVKMELKKSKAVVLYAHGHFYDNPLDSYIQLGRDRKESNLQLNHIEETNDVASRFIFLANCGSGSVSSYSERITMSDKQEDNGLCAATFSDSDKLTKIESNELIGFYKTLFSKGVSYVGVSLSPETDAQATEHFVINFMSAYNGANEAEAFKNSILMIKSQRSAHPYYWGNYLLIGN